jgi:hypothetical protein
MCGTGSTQFEWLRSLSDGDTEEDLSTLPYDDSKLVIESVGYQDGGIYKCRCLPDGALCELPVYSECQT